MALVTITEASKLTKKNRTTLYRYIKEGKLSKTTDDAGKDKLDTSELLRVFGALHATKDTMLHNTEKQHIATQNDVAKTNELQQKIQQLEQQILNKDELLKAKDDHISSLKQALMLLEYKKEEKEQSTPIQEEPTQPPEAEQVSQPTAEIEPQVEEVVEPEPEKPKRKKFLGIF
ncbi:helix-turn-helix domain-containing protein (plasmid) [Entomomonas sp. E2T0]|uniref:helix-turn-helix domain-containing protein n=1 Tax=Entomomonas sp. E2T0 TaxID=2930213 RepID=UPI0022283EBB|nr:helix-turn-helix domain-containing protein [Entomomonas sp. E2T0]UYZ85597.1 helix-turn-helix domain-containing protein [Entomomonas sp. E2T0]